MECNEVAELLAKSSLSEVPLEQRQAAEAHMAKCRACKERWHAAYQSAVLYRAAKPRRDPASIKDAVITRIAGDESNEEPAPPGRVGGFEVISVLLVAVMIGAIVIAKGKRLEQ